eukprot:6211728-Pleurochrysis_carterae.AAC.1
MVHTQPVSSNSRHLQVKPIQSVGVTRQSPKDLPATAFVALIVGKRGSGKTTTAASLIRAYSFQKIYVVSPTCKSRINTPILQSMGVKIENCYDDPSVESLQMILQSIEEEERVLLEYKRKMKLWKTFVHSVENLDFWQLDELCNENGEMTKPEHEYGGQYPSSLLLCDDIVGSSLIRSKQLANVCILHRHLAGGNGVSLCFLTQSFISDTSGLPKLIRLQCTVLLMFRSYSSKELESISHECRGETTHEKFMLAYNTAMSGAGEHNFLMVDFLYKKNKAPSMFRRNLNEYIIL